MLGKDHVPDEELGNLELQ